MSSPKCMEEEELKSLIKVHLIVFASLFYCYFVASRIPKGKLRVLSLSPIFYLLTILPFQLSSLLPTGFTASFITWLSNFKLLLFCFDLGPLSSPPPKSFPIFLLISCLPIKTNQNPKKTPKLPLNFPIKALLFGLLLRLNDHKQNLHRKALLGLHCCLLYLVVDVVSGLCNLVTKAILRVELEMPSDEPYLSTSLRDFWGRRWNLMVPRVLREAVFEPMRSLCGPILGPQWAPLIGVVATFVVSGLMHELIFYYVTRVPPTWEVTWFFVLHGVGMVVESSVKRLLGRLNWRLHWDWAVSGPMTLAFVIFTAEWLFFPPLLRNGVDERLTKEFWNSVDCILGKIGLSQLN